MSIYILSTMTQSVGYTNWKTVDGVPIAIGKITVHGGSGIPSLRSGFGDIGQNADGAPVWTAEGIVTALDEGQYDLLKENPIFQKHLTAGLLKVVPKNIKNHDEVKRHAADMSRDSFQVLTSKTLKQKVKVTTDTAPVEQQFRL